MPPLCGAGFAAFKPYGLFSILLSDINPETFMEDVMTTIVKKRVEVPAEERDSHPIGTTLGTIGGMSAGLAGAVVAGAATGATGGAIVGPVGGAIGAIAGGIIGGLTGSEIAEQLNPSAEEYYWESNYSSRPYVAEGTDYELYRPAYRHGIEAARRHKGRGFEEIEPELRTSWTSARGNSKLEWDDARHASRDAYNRVFGVNDIQE